MRYGIIADIHSNLEAFQKALETIEPVDTIFCLGDIVGYGPNPSECIDLLQQIPNINIAGNHDLGCSGKIDLADFNVDAREACEWSRQHISKEQCSYLQDLPLIRQINGDILLVHGSPRSPIWEYILSEDDAIANFSNYDFRVCFVGHTHIPVIFEQQSPLTCKLEKPEPNRIIRLNKESRYIINAGSIGQPRDGNPAASFAIFDHSKWEIEFHRFSYAFKTTQRKMKKEGLSSFLINRLSLGI